MSPAGSRDPCPVLQAVGRQWHHREDNPGAPGGTRVPNLGTDSNICLFCHSGHIHFQDSSMTFRREAANNAGDRFFFTNPLERELEL